MRLCMYVICIEHYREDESYDHDEQYHVEEQSYDLQETSQDHPEVLECAPNDGT